MPLHDKLKTVAKTVTREIAYYRLLINDKRTPKLAKFLLWGAVGYTLMPFDLIPDFLPVIGHLDDLIIVPAFILVALKIIPEDVKSSCRTSVSKSISKC